MSALLIRYPVQQLAGGHVQRDGETVEQLQLYARRLAELNAAQGGDGDTGRAGNFGLRKARSLSDFAHSNANRAHSLQGTMGGHRWPSVPAGGAS